MICRSCHQPLPLPPDDVLDVFLTDVVEFCENRTRILQSLNNASFVRRVIPEDFREIKVRHVLAMTAADWRSVRNFGRKSAMELIEALDERGVTMDRGVFGFNWR